MTNSHDPEHLDLDNEFSKEALSHFPVFPLIHAIRKDVELNIDTALSWSQLTSPEINFTVVRPLVFKYAHWHNPAIIYAALVVRSHFQAQADDDLAFSSIITTRAAMCELLALKLLRHFTGSQIELVAVLTHAWNPLQSAPTTAVEQVKADLGGKEDDLDDPMNALEVAISTESKKFCSSPLVQNVINDIWHGHVVFSTTSTHALVQDKYKSRDIELYDHRNAPFLDHYRLRVPRYRSMVDFMNFVILLLLFVVCLATKQFDHFTWPEICFIVFLFGFILDEFAATQEHGWSFYLANMWNGFDLAFIAIFLTYFGLRIKGVRSQEAWYSDLAFDILACGACLLFPRMAFLSISNNVVIMALRQMIIEFVYFMSLAAICFSGLLYTLHNLAGEKWPVKNIAWLMVQIWFGNTYLSFVQAESFHPIFGPILMVCFAALSNTLLITILISILSATFARINENASEEFLFQFTISTLEGVKSDAVLAYQPPFNLAAYVILTALSFVLSPRTLHTVNVFLLRLTSFPVLVAIGCYERYIVPGRGLLVTSRLEGVVSAGIKRLSKMSIVDAFVGSGSKDLLTAVLRADVELDETESEHLLPPFGKTPTPLIVDPDTDNVPQPDFSAPASASHNGGNKGTQNLSQSRSRPESDNEPDGSDSDEELDPSSRYRRGRYISATSAGSISRIGTQRPPRTPTTNRSLSGVRTARGAGGDGLGMGLSSPLARTFSRRPFSMVEEGDGSPSKVGQTRQTSNDEVLAAVKRLEATLTSNANEGGAGTGVISAEEFKELSERQTRIEALLLSLTREMRGGN